jgi:hypothetical protein
VAVLNTTFTSIFLRAYFVYFPQIENHKITRKRFCDCNKKAPIVFALPPVVLFDVFPTAAVADVPLPCLELATASAGSITASANPATSNDGGSGTIPSRAAAAAMATASSLAFRLPIGPVPASALAAPRHFIPGMLDDLDLNDDDDEEDPMATPEVFYS